MDLSTNTEEIKKSTATAAKTKLTPEQQSAVRDWFYEKQIPIIPCYSRTKRVDIKDWPNIDFSQVDFDAKLTAGEYDNGIALVLGKTLSEHGYYSLALDFDGWDAVLEWFGSWEQVLSSSQRTRIEWHQDKNRIHYIFLAKRPVANRKINIKESKLEVRCENQLLFASPGMHEGGNPYIPLGTNEIAILDENQLLSLEAKIDSLSQGYMSDENKQRYIQWLEDSTTRIKEHEGRHDAIKTLGCSYYYRYNNGWKDLTDDQRYDRLQQWNQQHCIPPLPEKEFNDIWKWIAATHRQQRDKQHEQLEDERRKSAEHEVKLDDNIQQELKGNVFYITTNKPLKLTIAYNSTKMLIESSVKAYDNEVFANDGNKLTQKIKILNQNKLYLTCIPVSFIKHRNPLSFLAAATKYTITFVDGVGNRFTFKHKTLSEIIAGLKDDGYVQSDGAEGALGRMILAFAKNKTLVENHDMEYTGFFLDDAGKKIIASNLEIKDKISVDDLGHALKVIEELATKYYADPDRLDLLATSIAWGMVAPISFVFKSNINYLQWLHFWGSPNATKSNTGIIILALDGHHKDDRFIRNISNIDTIARLGEEIDKTTFPKLVDEVDLNDDKYRTLINQIKSAITSKILRSKFRPHGSSAIDIPALSPLILTSNPPPPLWDSAYMKRIIDRYFDKSETKKEDDPEAVAFRQFLATELDNLHHLGDFRNWYVIHHQDAVLSAVKEEKMTMLDLGTKILAAAYEYAGIPMPDWLMTRRLPQNQLETSFVDNRIAIKNAFETLINVNLKNFNKHNIFDESHIRESISNRVANLLDGKKLPYMKRSRNDENKVIINTGILAELYKHGVTRDQLPNLKALADSMNAEYTRDEKGMIIIVTMEQISNYFDIVEGDDA